MKYVPGGTLKDLIAQGPLDVRQAAPLLRQMAKALEHADQKSVITYTTTLTALSSATSLQNGRVTFNLDNPAKEFLDGGLRHDTLHDHAQVLLAVHEVQIVTADGQHPTGAFCGQQVNLGSEVNMTTITVSISDERMQKLRERASHYHVAPEDLVRVSLDDLLARPEEDFRQAVEYVLSKNTELYQRLA